MQSKEVPKHFFLKEVMMIFVNLLLRENSEPFVHNLYVNKK